MMNTMEKQGIEKRIATLIKQRDDFVTEANLQVARLNGAISAYQSLLSEEEATETDADGTTENPPAAL